ncbi:xanthine dehydrogenase [Nilaparvata lugens]|uniref:xanthine dehydrogenase n=1 Tax=Nilaparvata lugens TaxID=108931 RepID=UPI00193E5806|nr:xanthine dehydrogenase [Nilaparvata lugens]
MGESFVQTSSELVFFVNGKKVVDRNVDPEWTLLYYLRNKLRLCGTKLGCAEGGCGACTVMVSKYNHQTRKITHQAVNACLAPICGVHGQAVTTVEGIGSTSSRLHPVQQRIALAHGSQCGFCTPGIVMSMYALLRHIAVETKRKPTMHDLEVAFQGNLCRCTGYRPIIEGFRTFTEEWEQAQRAAVTPLNGVTNGNQCAMGDQCCRNKPVNGSMAANGCIANGNGTETSQDVNRPAALFDASEFLPYDPSQEPIFPPELQIERKYDSQYLVIPGSRATWYRPTSLQELLLLKNKFPQAKIINGNTEVGVEVKFKNCVYPVLIQPSQVAELSEITVQSDGIKVGAAVTLSDLESFIVGHLASIKILREIKNMLHWFAGKQIRNVGAIGGNIMTGSPISDLNPIFMAAGCELFVQSKTEGVRSVKMDEHFWTGYRRNVIQQNELLTHIVIPYTNENQYFKAYKQAKRREDDIAIVNAAFNLTMDGDKVKSLVISFGGMAPTTVIATKTGQWAAGKLWGADFLEGIYQQLVDELPLDPGAPGGMIQYRRSLTLSLFFKFYLETSQAMEKEGYKISIDKRFKSGKDAFVSEIPKSSQYFQVVPNSQEKEDLIGRPVVHQSAFKQATGEAKYCDDMPRCEGELYMALVTSTRARARILAVDRSEALAQPGVHAFFCADDIEPKCNWFGHIVPDEMVFAANEVSAIGQVIGAIIADDQIIAQRAAKLVKVQYEDIHPAIITIEDAIRENSFYGKNGPRRLLKGDPEAAFARAEHTLEGEVRIGGQEHFYLETNASLAIPKGEDDEIELICSTQHPTDVQQMIAHMLNLPSNRVVVKVKRMGGGFGGKESRSNVVALPLVFAANKLKRPIRCMLDRDEDILMSGQRHPFMGRYKVAFDSSGRITAADVKLYNNAGNTADLSDPVMERAMLHFENCFYIENVSCLGYVCKTNVISNTAFRGFGGPQGMFVGETMIRQIAEFLKKDVVELTELNMYREGQATHFNQELKYCTLTRCWQQVLNDSNFEQRKQQVEQFNKEHRWRKRGLAVVPTKFGIAFTSLFLNQAGALVHIYMDGAVLISHGGTEMGQGLHTKMLQVASRALGIPVDLIHISETSTDKVPNTSATAASSGSDLNGMAILYACETLLERLKPYKEANPKGTWKDWVHKAFFDRVSLSAAGFYKTPDIGYNFQNNTGMAFSYFTYGAAVSEVEIDCLTGDHQVRRTDIVMDLGESLNPAIDIGQIEGGFMQGQGLFTLEEMLHSPQGLPYTRGPGAYKIPGFADIPVEFNVALLKGAPNKRAVYSSKAVGEPPLFLASSVFFAIYEAVKAARLESGLSGHFRFDSPATAARIRMACADHITSKFPEPPQESYKPWNVVI